MRHESVRLGLVIDTRAFMYDESGPIDLEVIFRMAEAAESSGLDSVWLTDGLTEKPRPDALAILAALAMRTQRLRLGTAVLLAAMWPPVQLARMVSTIDLLSKGRTVLGVGVGGVYSPGEVAEWVAAGVPPKQRVARYEEVVELLKRLLRERSVTFSGRHFQFDGLAMKPRPWREGGVPLILACHTIAAGVEAQIQRVARLGDGFISSRDTPGEFAALRARVTEAAAAAGRESQVQESVAMLQTRLGTDSVTAREEAFAYIGWHSQRTPITPRWVGAFGPPEAVIERVQAYKDAGASTVIVRFTAVDQWGQLQRFIQDVLPAVSK